MQINHTSPKVRTFHLDADAVGDLSLVSEEEAEAEAEDIKRQAKYLTLFHFKNEKRYKGGILREPWFP